MKLFSIFQSVPCIKGTLFWLGITCYFLATQAQMLPGAAGVRIQDPQITCLMPWQSSMVMTDIDKGSILYLFVYRAIQQLIE